MSSPKAIERSSNHFLAGTLAYTVALGLQAIPFVAHSQPASGSQYSISVQSFTQRAAPIEEKEWYEKGPWPLVGAVAAVIVTNAAAVFVVYLQSSRGFNAVLRQRRIDNLSNSLNEFYNPLLSLLDINNEIFNKTGPKSFPAEEIEAGAAMLVWRETKQVILANNARILEILRSKTHLLHSTDTMDSYNELMVHVAMYETFQRVETDRYQNFRFPNGVRAHVMEMRSRVLKEFNDLAGSRL